MNIEELAELLSSELGSAFEVTKDSKGRVVIKTNYVEGEDGELIDYDSFSEEDEDNDFDFSSDDEDEEFEEEENEEN